MHKKTFLLIALLIFGCDVAAQNGKITQKWLKEQDHLLKQYYKQYQGEARAWIKISQALAQHGIYKNEVRCRERYMQHLDGIDKTPLTEDEKAIIKQLHEQLGNKWKKITEQLNYRVGTHKRSAQQIKNFMVRHHQALVKNVLKKKKNLEKKTDELLKKEIEKRLDNKKNIDWEEISNTLETYGIRKSPQSCKYRYKNYFISGVDRSPLCLKEKEIINDLHDKKTSWKIITDKVNDWRKHQKKVSTIRTQTFLLYTFVAQDRAVKSKPPPYIKNVLPSELPTQKRKRNNSSEENPPGKKQRKCTEALLKTLVPHYQDEGKVEFWKDIAADLKDYNIQITAQECKNVWQQRLDPRIDYSQLQDSERSLLMEYQNIFVDDWEAIAKVINAKRSQCFTDTYRTAAFLQQQYVAIQKNKSTYVIPNSCDEIYLSPPPSDPLSLPTTPLPTFPSHTDYQSLYDIFD